MTFYYLLLFYKKHSRKIVLPKNSFLLYQKNILHTLPKKIKNSYNIKITLNIVKYFLTDKFFQYCEILSLTKYSQIFTIYNICFNMYYLLKQIKENTYIYILLTDRNFQYSQILFLSQNIVKHLVSITYVLISIMY